MREIEDAKKQYIKALLKDWCDKYEGEKKYSVKGMKELIRLSEQAGLGVPIPQAGWPREMRWGVGRWWRHSTGVLDRQKDENGRVFFQIRKEFYPAIKQALIEHDHERAQSM